MRNVALLRGINIGGRTIKSAELKTCFEEVGYQNVQTVLATGNVIFDSDGKLSALKVAIENVLSRTFRYPAFVCIIRMDKLKRIVADYPFGDAGSEYHRYVIFKEERPDASALAAIALDPQMEAVAPGDKVIYWRVQKGHTLDSDFAQQGAKDSRTRFSTTRNMNTLEKIIARS